MRIISTGSNYRIFNDDLKTYTKLPVDYYRIRFEKNSGFFLERTAGFTIPENKIYGVHEKKVAKVINSLDVFPKNLGVILSGPKGIGKSLFAKLLGMAAVDNQIPVIIVDQYIPGIAAFIEGIDQTVMILFDEFDKTFVDTDNGEVDPQTTMLSLFDGTAKGKKLFVITCNKLARLNDYLVNRPGRFHYHYRFDYPTSASITEYLTDKLTPEYQDEIKNVIRFARKVDLNYDCLRSIAFELNQGISFSEAIKDLNIVNVTKERYGIVVTYNDGTVFFNSNYYMDLFGRTFEKASLYDDEGDYAGSISFQTTDITYDMKTGDMTIPKNKVRIIIRTYDDDEDEYVLREDMKSENVDSIVVRRVREQSLHYVL